MLAEAVVLLSFLDMPWAPSDWTEQQCQAWRAASLPNFHLCMDGPGTEVYGYCAYFDVDGDGDVDLRDWSEVTNGLDM